MAQGGFHIGRAALAVPFLLIPISFNFLMDGSNLMKLWQPAFDSGKIEWNGGAIPLYHVKLVDWYWCGLTVTFAPATLGFDPLGWWTGSQFLTQLAPLYAIWLLEDSRRVARRGTIVTLFMFLGQVLGTGGIVPLYHFITVYSGSTAPSPAERSPNRRRIRIGFWFWSLPSFLPLILLIYPIPVGGAFLGPRSETRHLCVWLWCIVPICLGVADPALAHLPLFSQASKPNHLIHRAIERHFGALVTLCAGLWIYMLAYAPYSPISIFVPSSLEPDDLISHPRLLWQADFLCTFGSAILFLVYQCIDMNRAGLFEAQDWLLPAMMPIMVVCGGPGTAVAIAWLWKERMTNRAGRSK